MLVDARLGAICWMVWVRGAGTHREVTSRVAS